MYALLAVGLFSVQTPAAAPAYLDQTAEQLVRSARERRGSRAGAIRGYQALVQERMLLGVRALRRDRVLYRKEMAARIAWHRGGVDTIAVAGARDLVPLATGKPTVPSDLTHDSPDLVFNPVGPRIGFGINDSSFVQDPIARGAEASYQYRSGQTSEIGFPEGRTIRLAELVVIPRREDFHLMAGALWIDVATGDVVETLFRPARPFDFQRDASPKDRAGVPGFLEPIRGEVQFVTIEYALEDGRWWLPRLMALEGVATVGSVATLPLRYELFYSDYVVEGDTAAPPHDENATRDSVPERDSIVVRLPDDSAGLLTDASLPTPFEANGPAALSAGELRDIAARLAAQHVEAPPATGIRFDSHRWLARYNRVEGASMGAAARLGAGRFLADLTARIGLADRTPNAELGVGREVRGARLRVALYRRLTVANPATNALGIGNSLNALLLGRDDGAYYRAWGAELAVAPAITARQRVALRLFWERQTGAATATEASVARWLVRAHRFPENIAASKADEFGATVTVRALQSELSSDVSVGTFALARASVTTALTARLPAALMLGVEGAAGTSAGSVPAQSLWYLGGPATLRGYGGLAAAGETFWRARVELANGLPSARLVAFSDVGWAGPRAANFRGRALAAVGGGVSLADGLVRLDLARALRAPTGWRLDAYVNGVL